MVISYPDAKKALSKYINQYNKQVQKETDKVKPQMRITAQEIIAIYGVFLNKANDIEKVDSDKLPPLHTNNAQLSTLTDYSTRTIQRHIKRLTGAGIITKKVFHGSNADYELCLNVEIILPKPGLKEIRKEEKEDVSNQRKSEAEKNENESQTTIICSKSTKCPHTYPGNNTGNINNLIIAVDNVENIKNQLSANEKNTGNITGNTGEIAFSKNENQEKITNKTGEIALRAAETGYKDFAGADVPTGQSDPDPARGNSLCFYTNLLWLMARNLLYRDTDLTEHQELVARQLIHKLYEPVSTPGLPNVHQQYAERISLVSKYIRKDPQHRFVPLPYLFFDTNNPNGFIGTKAWHKLDRQRKMEVHRELTLSRVIRRYQHNEKKDPAKKMPPLKMFRQCENTLGKLNDPNLVQRFHAAVLQHKTYRQLYIQKSAIVN